MYLSVSGLVDVPVGEESTMCAVQSSSKHCARGNTDIIEKSGRVFSDILGFSLSFGFFPP